MSPRQAQDLCQEISNLLDGADDDTALRALVGATFSRLAAIENERGKAEAWDHAKSTLFMLGAAVRDGIGEGLQ